MTNAKRVGHKMNMVFPVNVAGCLGRLPALAKIALCSLAIIFTLAACAAPTPAAPDEPPAQARAVDTPAPEPTAAPTEMVEDTPAPTPEAVATPAATEAPVQAPTAMAAPTAAPVAAPTAAAAAATAAPVPAPTEAPQPASTPTPAATSTPQPTSTPVPAPTTTPQPASGPEPTSTPRPTLTPAPAPAATVAPYVPPSIALNPSRAAPGSIVTMTGRNLPVSTPVTQIRIGGAPLAAPGVVTGSDGSFSTGVMVPIALDIGIYFVQVTVGGQTTTAPLTVVPSAPVFGGTPVAQAFAPLGSNLRWVAFFDGEVQDWLLYDPNGTFSPTELVTPFGSPDPNTIGVLTHIESGQIYNVSVTNTQTVTLGGRSRNLTGGGYKQVVW